MKHCLFLFFYFCFLTFAIAQPEIEETKKEPPKFKLTRAEENYDYLRDKENNPYKKGLLDVIKFIPLNVDKTINLSFGGEIRPRVESFTNRNWTEEDVTFYTQRLSLHFNLNLGSYVRLFGELYHGYTSHRREFLGYDEIDWHQGFI